MSQPTHLTQEAFTVELLIRALKKFPGEMLVLVADSHMKTREMGGKETVLSRCQLLHRLQLGLHNPGRKLMNFTIPTKDDVLFADALCLFPAAVDVLGGEEEEPIPQ